MRRLLLALMLLAPAAIAQVVTSTERGVVVAHEGRVRLEGSWDVAGVEYATGMIAGSDRVAVLDALHNRVAVVTLAEGRVTTYATAETPVAAAFLGAELYVLCRDAALVQTFGPAREPRSIPLPAHAGRGDLMRGTADAVYVYAKTSGVLTEIAGGRVARNAELAPFASDLELAGTLAYLVDPVAARIRVVDLEQMKPAGEVAVGAVPVDVALAGGGSAITAPILAVADPSAKRVWLTESTQSMAKAIARGFLRGLLGLGLFGSRSSQFPTGVDRVEIAGRTWIAYDSSTGTLYRFTRRTSTVVARGVAPHAFTVTPRGVAWWQDGRVAFAQ